MYIYVTVTQLCRVTPARVAREMPSWRSQTRSLQDCVRTRWVFGNVVTSNKRLQPSSASDVEMLWN